MQITKTIYDEGVMPRYAVDKYPMGSYTNQRGPGIPINHEVASTLKLYAKKIMKDMQFLALIAGGDGGVRMGKSTVGQGWGAYYTEEINKRLKKLREKPITFTAKNIAMSFEDLKEKAFKVDRYSCLILDESDDLSAHALSKQMQEINSFLQKNGQLNLFIILITDDFFKFPPQIAVTRSNFLAVVKFKHDDEHGKYYERGFYDLFDVKDKRILYYKGKKNYRDIDVHKPTLRNVYFHGDYLVDEKEYLAEKRKDLEKYKRGDKNKFVLDTKTEYITKCNTIGKVYDTLNESNGVTIQDLAECMKVSSRTVDNWLKFYRLETNDVSEQHNNIYSNIGSNDCDGAGLEEVREK